MWDDLIEYRMLRKLAVSQDSALTEILKFKQRQGKCTGNILYAYKEVFILYQKNGCFLNKNLHINTDRFNVPSVIIF